MVTCPKCRSRVKDTAKNCAECGQQLGQEVSELAWTAAMRAELKEARFQRTCRSIGAGLSVILAVGFGIFFSVSHPVSTPPAVIIGFEVFLAFTFIVFAMGAIKYGRKIKEFMTQLVEGQKR